MDLLPSERAFVDLVQSFTTKRTGAAAPAQSNQKETTMTDAKPNKFAPKAAAAPAKEPKAAKPSAPAKAAKAAAPKAEKPAKVAKEPKDPAAPRVSKGITVEAGKAVTPVRFGTKTSVMLELLSRKTGATAAELSAELSLSGKPWDEKAVKAGLHWDVRNKGYGVKTVIEKDGTHRYHLVFPVGVTKIALTEKAEPKPKAEKAPKAAPAAKAPKAAAKPAAKAKAPKAAKPAAEAAE